MADQPVHAILVHGGCAEFSNGKLVREDNFVSSHTFLYLPQTGPPSPTLSYYNTRVSFSPLCRIPPQRKGRCVVYKEQTLSYFTATKDTYGGLSCNLCAIECPTSYATGIPFLSSKASTRCSIITKMKNALSRAAISCLAKRPDHEHDTERTSMAVGPSPSERDT